MSELKSCPFENARCLCADCKSNASYEDCNKGFSLSALSAKTRGKRYTMFIYVPGMTGGQNEHHWHDEC